MQLFLVYLTAIAATVGSVADVVETATLAEAALLNLEEQSAAATTAAVAGDKIGISDGVEFSPIPLFNSFFEIIPCDVKDAHKNECIKGLFDKIVPKLKDGLPEYNMASIDPYFYRRGIFRYDNDGIQGGLLIKNMQINGISSLKVTNVVSNFTENGLIIKLNIEIPNIMANGQFKADVKFGGLRLVPKGPFNITIDNIRATVLTDGSFENIEAGRRLKLHRLNANVALGNTRIIANGIFSDRNLNSMILNLVNENLPEITRVGIPATREQWAPILVSHINDFFASVPIDKMLVL